MKKLSFLTEPDGIKFTAWHADRFFSRLRGFMGRSLCAGDAMLLTPCCQIHCFFMKSPVDVVYLSRQEGTRNHAFHDAEHHWKAG